MAGGVLALGGVALVGAGAYWYTQQPDEHAPPSDPGLVPAADWSCPDEKAKALEKATTVGPRKALRAYDRSFGKHLAPGFVNAVTRLDFGDMVASLGNAFSTAARDYGSNDRGDAVFVSCRNEIVHALEELYGPAEDWEHTTAQEARFARGEGGSKGAGGGTRVERRINRISSRASRRAARARNNGNEHRAERIERRAARRLARIQRRHS